MVHNLLSLNYDILSNILPLISPHDAAQLALASHAAYALAFPRFLSNISLGGLHHKPSNSAVSQLKAFCNFVLAPAPCWHGAPTARLDGLRSLEIMRDAVRVRKDGARVVDTSAVALLSSVLERAHSLQKLTLWGSDALFTVHPTFALGSSPSIHTLTLGGDVASLPALAQAFPHIRTLEFISGGACPPDWAFFGPDSNPEALAPWKKSLQRVDTGFPILPLACPVRRVDLRHPIVPESDAIVTAHHFLAATRPVVLSGSMSTFSQPEDLCAMLYAAALSLRYLDLVGDRCESTEDALQWMTHVAQGLALIPSLSLLGITLSVTPAIVSMAATTKPQPVTPPTPPQKAVDVAALARSVADSVPSLQFVTVDLSGARGGNAADHGCFRVLESATGSARKVLKISEEEGLAAATKMRAFNRYD